MLLRGALVVLGLSVLPDHPALAQPPTERPAANALRAAAVKAKGTQINGDHIMVWFPASLQRTEIERLVTRVDAAVGEAKRIIGHHDWQRNRDKKITYYLFDGQGGANSSSEGEAFIPVNLVKQEGRAPWLQLALQELLTPKRPFPVVESSNDPDVRLRDFAFSIWHGVGDYIRAEVNDRTRLGEIGSLNIGMIPEVDSLCAKRLGSVDPAKVIPYMGEAGRPRELFGPERPKWAAPFNTCAVSFTKFLVERSSLQSVIGLMNKLPDGVKAVQAEIQRITGTSVSAARDEWQRKIGVKSAGWSAAVDMLAHRTPDGRPDLQGIWNYATATPVQRPEEFADRPFITDEEAAQWVANMLATRSADIRNKNPVADLGRENNEFWFEQPTQMAKLDGRVMTSLVVDPPNGRVPMLPLEPKGPPPDPNRADNPEDRNAGERCLLHSAGPPMVGGGPGSHYLQIVQTPDYVMLYAEAANSARIISTQKREHLPGDMRQWRGDSVGRWEGDTFVVESKNFRGGTAVRGFGVAPAMTIFTRPDFHLVERFSLAAPDVLLYEFTVTNPKFFAQPWTVREPMARTDARMFETACHEGNNSLEFILRGARAVEKEKALQPQD